MRKTTHGRNLCRVVGVVLGIAIVVPISACGGSDNSVLASTPSARSDRPVGGPVPAQMIGQWSMAPQAVTSILEAQGNPGCPQPLDVSTCMVRFKLTATQYGWTTNLGLDERAGEVVVNRSEIDFFNGPACGLKLPAGVGRYTWTLTGQVLHFASVANDPCPRRAWLDNQSYSRAS